MSRFYHSFALISVFPMVALCQGTPQDANGSAALAEFKSGRVSQTEFDHWTRYMGVAKSKEPRHELEQLAFVKWLAQKARTVGEGSNRVVQVQSHWMNGEYALKLVWSNLYQEIQIAPSVLTTAYEEAKDRLNRPRRVRLRNLFKRFPPNATQAEKQALAQKMTQLRTRLERGADFATLALAESHSQTRFNQGILGNVKQGVLRPEIDRVAMMMKPKELSPVIETDDGLTLLYCEAIIPEMKRSQETFKADLKNRLRQQKFEEAKAAMTESAIQSLVLAIDWDLLKAASDRGGRNLVTKGKGVITVAEYLALLRYRNVAGSPKRPLLLKNYLLRKEALAVLPLEMATRQHLHAIFPLVVDQAVAGQYLASLVRQKITRPDEQTLRQVYEQRKHKFLSPPQYQLEIIALPLRRERYQESYRNAVTLLHRLEQGHLSFSDAAHQYSQHASKTQGGQVGWLGEQQLLRKGITLVKAVRTMNKGQTSDLVEDGDHLWILRLVDKKAPSRYPFEAVKSRIENFVGQQRTNSLESELIQAVYQEYQQNVQADSQSPR